ncbi:glycosyltransferase family 2 protein [Microbacterium oryzae]|uniref:glycosyltransferase family 2 protein n=1 Tax=Microbacterium oryzae TaxID=743009 RepID=UPI0025B2127F|nr:glycosyltransferase family 2 protein [Microbacterium oryzae]MDN3310111.1 glycosyltransferase family 2 protein [Microbacterium oryzae]
MPDTPLHRVSVVMPLYNYEQYLDEAMRSVLSQEGVDLDVTIIDDRSTDRSYEMALRWQDADPRVRVIQHTTNRGHIATFNDALESATAPYVVKLDPDDLLTPGSLRRSADVLAAHPDVAFVYGRCRVFSGEAPAVPTPADRPARLWSGERWVARRSRGGANVIYQPEVMIRVSALREVGGHLAEVSEASDYNLWLRLATTGRVARLDGAVQGLYRVHENSMQRTIHSGELRDLRARVRAWELFLEQRGRVLSNRCAIEQAARRTLSREVVIKALDLFDGGAARSQPIAEFRALALELDPAIVRSARWRELSRRMDAGLAVATPRHSPTRIARQLRWNHRIARMRRFRT